MLTGGLVLSIRKLMLVYIVTYISGNCEGAAWGVVKLGEWVCYYDVSNIVNLRALNGGN